MDPNEPLYWTRRAVEERHLAETRRPPKGSIAYDRLMQAANPPPPARRKRPDPPEYDDEYFDVYFLVYDNSHRFRFKLDAGWIAIGALGIAGLFFCPLLVVAGCVAVSRYRGPNHYTKFMVPYPYQFKWDAGWIFVLLLGALGRAPGSPMAGGGWISFGSSRWLGCSSPACIAPLRCVLWLCFRFPLTSWFFVLFFVALFFIGGRRAGLTAFW